MLLQVTEGPIASPRTVNRSVPRNLETVVLRRLAFEPDRRYPGAGELADDLRRFLEDRPIKARRTTLLEHTWRWCRRNPAVALLSASLLLVFLIGFAGVAWKWQEASANLDLAKTSLQREEEQRRRRQGNLNLAMEAFDKIARQLASGRPGVPLDAGEETPTAPVVTPEVAAVSPGSGQLPGASPRRTATTPGSSATRPGSCGRSGTIRLRLGEYEQAQAGSDARRGAAGGLARPGA